ncbi:MAG TPA: hypothetical protein VIU62_01430 [Chloroflexota bacterium]
MSSAVTTSTINAVTSSISSLSATAAIGIAALLLLIVFLLEKEVLISSARPEIASAARYLNVVIVPLLLAFALIATFRLGMAADIIR